jgi:hypothetical protein
LILCVLLSIDVYARDYYVSAMGNDSNPGTGTQPWRSIAKVNDFDFKPGDIILFEGGKIFAGTIKLDKNDSGSSDKQIVITSYGTSRAIIDGANGTGLIADGCNHLIVKNLNLKGSGRKAGNTENGVHIIDLSGAEIDNLDVSGFRSNGILGMGIQNVRITNVHAYENGHAGICVGGSPSNRKSDNVYIGYCVAQNNPGDPSNLTNHSGNGIVVGNINNAVIEYCRAMNNGWDMPRKGNGPVGIWAWNADNVVIQFCIAHDNKSPGDDGGGFDLDGGVTNSILQYNLSYNNEGPGYFLCQYPSAPVFKNNIVRYNISQNDGTKNNRRSGIDIYAANTQMSDCKIYNNTVYNKNGAGIGFAGLDVPGVVIRNNIFICAGELITGKAKRGRFENNIYWAVDDRGLTFNGHTFEQWIARTGQEKIGDKIVGRYVDPLLIEPGGATLTDPTKLATLKAYRLKTGSPCAGAGIPIENNGGRDFWGNKVPEKECPAVGAGL